MSRTPAIHLQRVGRKRSEWERNKAEGAMPSVLHFLFTSLDMSLSNFSGNPLSRAEDILYVTSRVVLVKSSGSNDLDKPQYLE